MDYKQTEEMEIDIWELLRTLWKHAWVILLAAIGVGAIVFLYFSFLVTPKYTAETLLYVTNRSEGASNISSSDLTAAQSLVDTYGVILTARSTMEEVLEVSGTDYSVEELLSMVSSSAVDSTEVLSIQVTDADRTEAATIANAIAEVLPEKISEHITGCSVSVVDLASVPEEPSSPRIKRNTMIGFMLGFILGCAYIVIQFLMDTRIHDEEFLRNAYDLPVLAAIPDLRSRSSQSGYYTASEMNATGRRVAQK